MIKSISFRNFRGIPERFLEFGPGVNFLKGPNEARKIVEKGSALARHKDPVLILPLSQSVKPALPVEPPRPAAVVPDMKVALLTVPRSPLAATDED